MILFARATWPVTRVTEAFQEVDYQSFGPSTKGFAKRVERHDERGAS